MSLVVPPNFQHILRVLNTNIDGKTSIMFALTSIKGIGRRYANLCLKKADISLSRRAGELNEEEVEKLITIMQVSQSCLNHCHSCQPISAHSLLGSANHSDWVACDFSRHQIALWLLGS